MLSITKTLGVMLGQWLVCLPAGTVTMYSILHRGRIEKFTWAAIWTQSKLGTRKRCCEGKSAGMMLTTPAIECQLACKNKRASTIDHIRLEHGKGSSAVCIHSDGKREQCRHLSVAAPITVPHGATPGAPGWSSYEWIPCSQHLLYVLTCLRLTSLAQQILFFRSLDWYCVFLKWGLELENASISKHCSFLISATIIHTTVFVHKSTGSCYFG